MTRTAFPTFNLDAVGLAAAGAVGLALAGCGGGDLPGQYFSLSAHGEENLCTGSGTDYSTELEYRLIVESNSLQVAVDDDIFASGTIEGCSLSYSSIVWADYRDDLEIKWQIIGSADANLGGAAGCVNETDWQGTEEFVVITSEHPDVLPGCTYTLGLSGKFLREVEDGKAEEVDPVQ